MRRAHRRAHRGMWWVLAIALPTILFGALALRQDLDRVVPPERLEAPQQSEAAE